MAVTLLATISQTAKTDVPAGPAFAGILFSLLASDGTVVDKQLGTAAPYTATFANVADGTYTVTGQSVDVTGALLGASISTPPFSAAADPAPAPTPTPVPAPLTMTIDTPISISVVQQ